ncbi:MAG: glycine betaine ABC transporter substrate-binding protein [Gammaproteobacteria bacterium]
MHRFYTALLLLLCALQPGQTQAELRVASKKFTESVILAEIATRLLRSEDIKANHLRDLGGTRILWSALLSGEIDIYPEYTGTLRQEIFAGEGLQDFIDIQAKLRAHGIGMTAPLGFDNTYVLGMLESKAAELNIRSITDLQRHPELALGFSNEFMSRGDGWPSLRLHYQLPQQQVKGLDHDLAYRGLESGDIAVTDLYNTDAEIVYYQLRRLSDDKRFFPEYQAVYLYRQDSVKKYPGSAAKLAELQGNIDQHLMTTMNRRVKIDRQDAGQVAVDYLRSHLQIDSTYQAITRMDRLLTTTMAHLYLVLVSLAAAILVAVPLGVVAAKQERLARLLLGGSSIVQTIPALALFVFLIPFLGIGTAPTIVALFLYSLLPILRNTASGLHDIPSAITESAIAMGLPAWERLKRIELPLALRPIMAGIKTAAVINVGLATLGALIGAGGYGQPILAGIRLDDVGLILEGAIPAALLALLVQYLFEFIETRLLPDY